MSDKKIWAVGEYESNVEVIDQAFRSFLLMTMAVNNEDLGRMEREVENAESVGFLFVAPIEYMKAIEKGGTLDYQKTLFSLLRKVRADLGRFINLEVLA